MRLDRFTSLSILFSTTSALALLLSACPPPFDELPVPGPDGPTPDAGLPEPSDGGDVDAGLLDGGTLDAGNDGGTLDAGNDGGTLDAGNDGGTLDAGDDGGAVDAGDGGALDAGDDGGALDAGDDGGDDGGALDAGVDAGPCVYLDFHAQPGWNCQASGIGGDCFSPTAAAIVDMHAQCPDTFVLDERGLISKVTATGRLQQFANCAGPPIQFTDLEVRGQRAIAFEKGGSTLCYAAASSTCNCPTQLGPIFDAHFVSDDVILVTTGDAAGSSFEYAFGATAPTTLDGVSFASADYVIVVLGPDGEYRAGVYPENGTPICFTRSVGAADGATSPYEQCPGFGAASWPRGPVDLEEQHGSARGVHVFQSTAAFQTLFDVDQDQKVPEKSTTLIAPPGLSSFSARGVVGAADYRTAVGGDDALLSVSKAGNSPSTIAEYMMPFELSDILELTFGIDEFDFPTSIVWAAARNGVWRIDPSMVLEPAFTPWPFQGTPSSIAAVRLGTQEKLVVGHEDGSVDVFTINSNGTVTHEDQFTTSGQIIEAIVAPRDGAGGATTTVLTVLNTGGEIWGAAYDNTGVNTRTLVLENSSLIGMLQGISGGLYLSQPAFPTGGVKEVYVSIRRSDTSYNLGRYEITAENSGDLSPAFMEARPITALADSEIPFRFHALQVTNGTDPNRALVWTSNNGSTTFLEMNATDNFIPGRAVASIRLNNAITGGSYPTLQNQCATMFSEDGTGWYTMTPTSTDQIPFRTISNGFRLNNLLSLSATTAIAVGDEGQLIDIRFNDACNSNDHVLTMDPLFPPTSTTITALKWRGPNEVVVGDASGRVYVVNVGP